jgi:hypothetical protein
MARARVLELLEILNIRDDEEHPFMPEASNFVRIPLVPIPRSPVRSNDTIRPHMNVEPLRNMDLDHEGGSPWDGELSKP